MEADVAVVGAGPAGAATACHFASAGFRVLLMDQQRFPRDKVCGDFVGPWAMEELERVGLSSAAPFGNANRIRRAEFHLNGQKVTESAIPGVHGLRDYGLCIPRVEMDDAVVQAALGSGALLFQDARVTGYETDAQGVTVHYQAAAAQRSVRTRLLIGADGSTSLIARILRGRRLPRRDRIVAIRAYFEDIRGPMDQADLCVNASVFPGYVWLFPSGERSANVGIGMLQETLPPNKEQLRENLSSFIRSDPVVHARLERSTMRGKMAGWPLATFNPHLSIAANRVALIGDAAGLINPLNGEGIQYAFQSARWCFETLANPLAQGNVSLAGLAPYVDRVHAEMRLDMAVSRLLIDLTRNRMLNQLWLTGLQIIGSRAAADPDYADVFGGVFAGIVRPRELLTAPFIARTLQQATRMGARLSTTRTLGDFLSVAKDAAQHPVATLDWALHCAGSLRELTDQLATTFPNTKASA